MEIDTNLIHGHSGQTVEISNSRLGSQVFESSLNVLRGGDRQSEPEIELVVARVIVSYAGKTADKLGDLVKPFRPNAGSNQRRGITQPGRIEDSSQAANYSCRTQPGDPGDHLVGFDSLSLRQDIEQLLDLLEPFETQLRDLTVLDGPAQPLEAPDEAIAEQAAQSLSPAIREYAD